ncbi:hypothetical protein [Candidatus Erwinia haradaeae]|uniref:hypothetical protein n=1 Tax=Candidatus Erwinia haradaeae TaxID=1922217 RepID=UPI00130064B6|nr:hypothetical protein [Candidatus Erwinia haradaeae]
MSYRPMALKNIQLFKDEIVDGMTPVYQLLNNIQDRLACPTRYGKAGHINPVITVNLI